MTCFYSRENYTHIATNHRNPKYTYSRAEDGLSFCSYKATRTGKQTKGNIKYSIGKVIDGIKQSIEASIKEAKSFRGQLGKKRNETFGEGVHCPA